MVTLCGSLRVIVSTINQESLGSLSNTGSFCLYGKMARSSLAEPLRIVLETVLNRVDPCSAVFGMAGSRLLGTVMAHFLMVPGAMMIAWIARVIPS